MQSENHFASLRGTEGDRLIPNHLGPHLKNSIQSSTFAFGRKTSLSCQHSLNDLFSLDQLYDLTGSCLECCDQTYCLLKMPSASCLLDSEAKPLRKSSLSRAASFATLKMPMQSSLRDHISTNFFWSMLDVTQAKAHVPQSR